MRFWGYVPLETGRIFIEVINHFSSQGSIIYHNNDLVLLTPSLWNEGGSTIIIPILREEKSKSKWFSNLPTGTQWVKG